MSSRRCLKDCARGIAKNAVGVWNEGGAIKKVSVGFKNEHGVNHGFPIEY